MKCSKCKYVTFDYLDACPRCGKDMSREKLNLNITSIKPNTPFLLGSLTGDLNDSNIGFTIPESIEEKANEIGLKHDEIYDDGSELDINFEEEEEYPLKSKGSSELDLGDLELSEESSELDLDLDSEERGLSMEFEGLEKIEKSGHGQLHDLENNIERTVKVKEPLKKKTQETPLDLGDLDIELDFDEDEDLEK